MKYLISERQYNLIKEDREILEIPSLEIFNDDWELLQRFLERRGNPFYSIGGDLNLSFSEIESLGNLVSVGEHLYLNNTAIESLGNLKSVGGFLTLRNTPIKSLGNLVSVGGFLDIKRTSIESLGNLESVGGGLFLYGTPISKTMSKNEIRAIVNVDGNIYF